MRRELRLAWRTLVRRPALSSAIIATIGLAIAATTLAFAVVNGVLLAPLPYAEPDRLVAVWEWKTDTDNRRNVVSPANYYAWREQLKSFDRLAIAMETGAALTGDGEPDQVGAFAISPDYFDMVGATPLIGRLYRKDEDADGGPKVTVLSEGFWRRRYGGDPRVVGRAITVNGTPTTVIGVLPARFDFVPRYRFASTGSRDLWLPPQFGARALTWSGRFLQVVGRLAPGVSLGSARSEAGTVAARLRAQFPDRNSGWDINLVPLHEEMVGDVRTTVLTIFGAVCFVLLIACSNVANLLLTRATERQQEMAVRAALGAGRTRLFRQLLAESLVLSAAGGAVGLALAGWGVRVLVRLAPDLPRLEMVRLDGSVLAFTVAAVVATAVLFGLAPAVQLTGQELATWLTQRSGGTGRGHVQRLRSAFVGAQVALSFILLVGAGLLIRSLVNRLDASLGFPIDHLVSAELSIGGASRQSGNTIDRFDQIVQRVAAVPGITSASVASVIPMGGEGQSTGFEIVGRPTPAPGQEPVANVRFVEHHYFQTMGIPVLEGRALGPDDRAGQPIHVVINQAGAKLHWPGESAVGKRITMEWGDTLHAEIVGVVGDVKLEGPDDQSKWATIYWDYRQAGQPGKVNLLVRSPVSAEAIVPAVRAAVHEVDPTLPLYNVRTFEMLLRKAVARASFTTMALGIFAALALLLAVLGLYGVMAYATQQRTREIGIRLALGADPFAVIRMVLRQGVGVVAPSLAVGAVGALILARLLRSLVYGVSPADPATFAVVAALLGASGFLACWLPARRASAIDPVSAIRTE